MLDRLEIEKEKLEIKLNKIKALEERHFKALVAKEHTEYLQENAGKMIFTGFRTERGTVYDMNEVVLNDVAGCQLVPELIIQLANKKIKEIEEEIGRVI